MLATQSEEHRLCLWKQMQPAMTTAMTKGVDPNMCWMTWHRLFFALLDCQCPQNHHVGLIPWLSLPPNDAPISHLDLDQWWVLQWQLEWDIDQSWIKTEDHHRLTKNQQDTRGNMQLDPMDYGCDCIWIPMWCIGVLKNQSSNNNPSMTYSTKSQSRCQQCNEALSSKLF